MHPAPLDASYLDALFATIRDAGEHLASVQGLLAGAERTTPPGWRMQLVAAARNAHVEAGARIAQAEERLASLGAVEELPAPLDQLPRRLEAMRAELRAAELRLARVAEAAASRPVGQA
jgi:outer membrane murein-binding lipoprotein Lpp